jgi:aspartate aminotransferase
MALNAQAMALKKQGKDILNLAAGEPDFDTPEYIRAAAHKALEESKTHYTPTAGIPELREAVAGWASKRVGRTYAPEQIIITPGTKFAVYMGLASYIEPGDDVLVPTPYWVSYPPMVKMLGARPVHVWGGIEQGFKITVADLEKACTSGTKGLIFNSPSNPTGAAYTAAETRAIAEWCAQKSLWILSDEIYVDLRYVKEPHCSIIGVDPRQDEWQVLADGFSKCYAMTGWRLGVLAGSKALVKTAVRLAEQTTSCATSISQYAALAAVTGPQDDVRRMAAEFRKRRDRMHAELVKIKDLGVGLPDGAFYFFLDVRAFFGRRTPGGKEIKTSEALCLYLLESVGLVGVPGEGFGAPGYMRISYASGLDVLLDAAERLRRGLQALQ